MASFYLAVTIRGDKNEVVFSDRENSEIEVGYHSYVEKIGENCNLKNHLDGIGGLIRVNICPTKKAARLPVDCWNQTFKSDGKFLFDNPRLF